MRQTCLLILFCVYHFGHTLGHATCNPAAEVSDEVKSLELKAAYGEEFKANEVVSLGQALKNFSQFDGKELIVSAQVQNVCRQKGCWMSLGEWDDQEIRVRFKDYGFFVPITLVGKNVLVKGKLERKKIDVGMLRHLKEDAGASPEEIAQVTQSAHEYTFTSVGVKVVQ